MAGKQGSQLDDATAIPGVSTGSGSAASIPVSPNPQPSHSPVAAHPASIPEQPRPVMTPGAIQHPRTRDAVAAPSTMTLPPLPRDKDMRVIRVRTPEQAVIIINAEDFDPEIHEPITAEDKRWGDRSVEAKRRMEEKLETLASLKRTVRGL